MGIDKHLNTIYSGGIPLALGDRYYSQDLIRDHWFQQDRLGQLIADMGEGGSMILSGGEVTQGTGDTLNITPCIGYHKLSVEIPDTFASIPPTVMDADVEAVRVVSTQQTNLVIASAVLDGTTPNYVKLTYSESAGNIRTRAKKVGDYSYEMVPSFAITVDDTPPTAYEICLRVFTGSAGGSFTFYSYDTESFNPSPKSGWLRTGELWKFDSADSPTFLATVAGDKRSKYSKGMKLKLEQEQALTNYWSFDTDKTEAVAGVVMTDIGTPTYSAGKFGNALTLNGTNQALKCADNTFKPTGAFTIGMWVKIANATNVNGIFQSQRVLTSTIFSGITLYTNQTTGFIYFRSAQNTGASGNGINLYNPVGTKNICDNAYHYIVVSFKDDFVQIYVDGVLDISAYCKAPVYNATTYTRIGCLSEDGSTNAYFLNGQIEDLFLINGYALDEETIRAKYESDTAQGVDPITVTKKFILTDISYSSPNTTLTMYGGIDFALSSGAISNPFYSMVEQPYGFNRNPDKWSVIVANAGGSVDPVAGGVYEIGNFKITIPIGAWSPIHTSFSFQDIYNIGATTESFFLGSYGTILYIDLLGTSTALNVYNRNIRTTHSGVNLAVKEEFTFKRTANADIILLSFAYGEIKVRSVYL